MYIAPNSTIKLLKNVPLDASYDHTVYFSSKTQQRNWFEGYIKPGMVFEKQYYQRHSRDYIKLEVLADNVYDCNYIMFRNTSYGTKWFYAFITNVEYVNNNVTLIQYQIDAMQTWHFDYTLGECFVEREHSASDAIGENLVPENVATGDYWTEKLGNVEGLEDLSIVLFCTVDENYHNIDGVFREGIFSGLYPVTFPCTTAGSAQAVSWIQNLPILKIDAIKCACIMPTTFAEVNIVAEAAEFTKKTTLNRTDGLGGYEEVKNNKLLTYPYNFLYVTNNEGKCAIYPYEYFESSTCMFELFGDYTPNPQVIMYPLLYKGSSQNEDESIQLGGYPQIAFDVDSFKAWLAQSASAIGIAALGAVNHGIASFPIPLNGGETTIGEVSPTISNLASLNSPARAIGLALSGTAAIMMPPQARGSQSSAVKIPAGMMNFTFYRKFIRPEFAAIIDDYFSMFGYATRRLKIPNTAVRTCWTYTKTIGCNMTKCNVPADDAKLICSLYDRGITFWMSTATVGDYSQSNNVLI